MVFLKRCNTTGNLHCLECLEREESNKVREGAG
uniref:Uncharacterized protein n=1 Tax=Arundo donax TaxID=35708 RepID=A0A0A9I1N5_ARUDO